MSFYSVTSLQVGVIIVVVSEFETFGLLGYFARGGGPQLHHGRSLKAHISELEKIFHI